MSVVLIAFDIGGVLTTINKNPLRALMPETKLEAFFDQDFFLLQRGFVSPEDFLAKKSTLLRLCSQALTSAFLAMQKPSAQTAYLRNVSAPYIFASNINEMHYRSFKEALDLPSFTRKNAILSYRLGFLKPHARFFWCLGNALRVRPDQILFIDDSEDNCGAASKQGLQTICCPHPEALPSLLSGFGLLR